MTTMRITYRCPNCSQVDNHADNCPSRDKQRLSLTNDYEGVITEQPASGAGSEQSRLFPRYSFAVVTGRYKILDNRSGKLTTNQIATADGEDEARAIVQALNAAEQHSTLVEQRDRLLATLRQARNAAQVFTTSRHLETAQEGLRTIVYDIDKVLTTIEQEGETRG